MHAKDNFIIKMKKVVFTLMLSSVVFATAQEKPEDLNRKTIDSLRVEVQALKEMMTLQSKKKNEEEKPKEQKWYDKISLGGYIQLRYNELLEENPKLGCEQCDGFWGDTKNGFSFRRVRFKFSGQITPRIYFYLQPDFAKTSGSSNYVGVLKDAYFDIGLNSKNEYILRLGLTKVPYGFGNLQSSSERIALDRDDATNSGLKDERDLGVFFMWTGTKQKEMLKYLSKNGLKPAGDYGVFALGIYNGQTGNSFDANKKFHLVTRFSYPFQIGRQIIEPGIQAYTGRFVLPKISQGTVVHADKEYLDQRIAASFVLYPQPFGIQAEYNIGKGPEYDVETKSVQTKPLYGGYTTFSYFIQKWDQKFIPFVRIHHYQGGKKHELDARSYNVKEFEGGIEWHPLKSFELVAMYTYSERKFRDFMISNYNEKGGLLRIQAQLKF